MHSEEVISIVKVEQNSDIYKKVRCGFELIGKPTIGPDDVVAIKPNLCCIKGPETGATTDLRIIEAIIRYLQEIMFRHHWWSNRMELNCLQTWHSNYWAMKTLNRLNVKLVNLSKSPFSTKVYENNSFLKKVRVPRYCKKQPALFQFQK